jgi:hypothetical protein
MRQNFDSAMLQRAQSTSLKRRRDTTIRHVCMQHWDHLQAGIIETRLQLVPYNYIAQDVG